MWLFVFAHRTPHKYVTSCTNVVLLVFSVGGCSLNQNAAKTTVFLRFGFVAFFSVKSFKILFFVNQRIVSFLQNWLKKSSFLFALIFYGINKSSRTWLQKTCMLSLFVIMYKNVCTWNSLTVWWYCFCCLTLPWFGYNKTSLFKHILGMTF